MKSQRDLDSTMPLGRRIRGVVLGHWLTSTFGLMGFLLGAGGGAWWGWNDELGGLIAALLLGGISGALIFILMVFAFFSFAGG